MRSCIISGLLLFQVGALKLYAYKSADTSRGNATLADDPHLVFSSVQPGTYRFQAFWRFEFVTAGAAGSLRASQALNTSHYSLIRARNGATALSAFAGSGANPSTGAVAWQFDIGGTDVGVFSDGYLIIPSATDLALQWAQRLDDAANPTTLRAGSWMALERMGA